MSYKGSSQTTPADLINKIFGDEGIIPLKPEEIDSMFVSNGQNKNDVAQEKFDLSDFWRPDSAFDGFPAPNTFGVNIT